MESPSKLLADLTLILKLPTSKTVVSLTTFFVN